MTNRMNGIFGDDKEKKITPSEPDEKTIHEVMGISQERSDELGEMFAEKMGEEMRAKTGIYAGSALLLAKSMSTDPNEQLLLAFQMGRFISTFTDANNEEG